MNSYGNAVVREHAIVCDHASVLGDACVNGYSVVAGGATVQGKAKLSGAVLLEDAAYVSGSAVLEDHVRVRGEAVIGGNALVGGHAAIVDNAVVAGCAVVRGRILIGGVTRVQDQVTIDIYPPGCVIRIFSDAVFNGDAVIHSLNDFIIMHNNWSSGRNFVWTRSNNMWSAGCFYGTGEELIKKAMQDSVASGKGYKHAVDYVESMLKDEATK